MLRSIKDVNEPKYLPVAPDMPLFQSWRTSPQVCGVCGAVAAASWQWVVSYRALARTSTAQ
jgi:hypothetical protein